MGEKKSLLVLFLTTLEILDESAHKTSWNKK